MHGNKRREACPKYARQIANLYKTESLLRTVQAIMTHVSSHPLRSRATCVLSARPNPHSPYILLNAKHSTVETFGLAVCVFDVAVCSVRRDKSSIYFLCMALCLSCKYIEECRKVVPSQCSTISYFL